ncbi:S1C family serine protease [Halalkalibacillus halophilus]|uniref:S1C family serine protease n=1 Tax=Halalkalibacillus halophilus TaxID=392827 RepID=UPI000423181D|nr:trypsin-like peptidase domain-containing protein [Halalkalibacillus halophilus]
MGYYDNHIPKKSKERGWLLPTFIGSILGALIILLALPALVQSDFIPYDLSVQEAADENDQSGESQGEEGADHQPVNVDISSRTTEIVEEVSSAVVGVVNIQNQNIFGGSQQQPENENAPTGSGVIYKQSDEYAYIVTNYHVIEGADSVEIVFSDEEQTEAEIVGGDMFSDLAVLRVDEEFVDHVIEIGDSNNLNVGEPLLAIGNPLGLQFAGSVTQGILSGKDRLIPLDFDNNGIVDWQAEVIQTDAAINPGNSGGALVNMEGELIGINSMKLASAQVEGLGFAIPTASAVPIMEELEQDGVVTRSYLGISPYSLTDVAQYHWSNTLNLPSEVEGGVLAASVENVSPAAQAGLEQYDVIVELDGTPVMNVLELRQHLYNETSPGDELTITFYRDGERQEVTTTLTSQEF